MKQLFAVLFAVFLSTILRAQDTAVVIKTTASKKGNFKAQMNQLALKQINQLHDGALLVRLFTREKSIASLRKSGNVKMANQMEAGQAELNRAIIAAFRTNFDFCPVYFFFSDESRHVREQKFDSIPFLNDDLQPDSSIVFAGGSFLTAEFGNIQQDTASYNYYVPGEIGPKRESPYYGGPAMGFGALIIKSDQFIQLRRPFPFYVRTYDSLPFVRRKPKSVVKRMNGELHEFYGS